MAWMSDEQYELIQDTREKSHTARSARTTRGHCGKSGCNFSHEKMSKKELAAMNGEVKSFRMNDPMTWEEFKGLPDDLKVIYVKNLRKAYGVTDTALSEMFGVHRSLLGRWFKTLNLTVGDEAKGNRNWNKEAFLAWSKGIKTENKTEEAPVEEPVLENTNAMEIKVPLKTAIDLTAKKVEELCETVIERLDEAVSNEQSENAINNGLCDSTDGPKYSVPVQGSMIFEGDIDDVLRSVSRLLDGQYVHIKVEWDLV